MVMEKNIIKIKEKKKTERPWHGGDDDGDDS